MHFQTVIFGEITTNKKQLGSQGERAAITHLEKMGWEILKTNLEVPPGECDIVGRDGRTMVFVEVKTAGKNSPVPPEEEITYQKKETLRRVARYVISRFSEPPACRFDVITLRYGDGSGGKLRHLENAFGGRR